MVKICGAARRSRRLAYSPAGEVFPARIACRFADPPLPLLLRTEPDQWHQGQAVDEQNCCETRVHGSDLFGNDLKVYVADATATVLARKEAHCKAELVTLDVCALHRLEGLLWIGLFVRLPYDGLQDFDGELARVPLELPLRFR